MENYKDSDAYYLITHAVNIGRRKEQEYFKEREKELAREKIIEEVFCVTGWFLALAFGGLFLLEKAGVL